MNSDQVSLRRYILMFAAYAPSSWGKRLLSFACMFVSIIISMLAMCLSLLISSNAEEASEVWAGLHEAQKENLKPKESWPKDQAPNTVYNLFRVRPLLPLTTIPSGL